MHSKFERTTDFCIAEVMILKKVRPRRIIYFFRLVATIVLPSPSDKFKQARPTQGFFLILT